MLLISLITLRQPFRILRQALKCNDVILSTSVQSLFRFFAISCCGYICHQWLLYHVPCTGMFSCVNRRGFAAAAAVLYPSNRLLERASRRYVLGWHQICRSCNELVKFSFTDLCSAGRVVDGRVEMWNCVCVCVYMTLVCHWSLIIILAYILLCYQTSGLIIYFLFSGFAEEMKKSVIVIHLLTEKYIDTL